MKVYIQKGTDNECSNINSFIALDGFRHLGWEICTYRDSRLLTDNQPEDVVVGGIGDIKSAFENLNLPFPAPLDYPDELHAFLGRKVWKSTIHTIASNPQNWNVFVKPAKALKTFPGVLLREERDLIGCYNPLEDIEIWCSEPVTFLSEWRCYVRYGKIVDVRPYRGDWRLHYDPNVIEDALNCYKNAPKGYAMDFGVTDKGETLLVEANDGYALGSYGLFSLEYAKLLSARWAELTNSKDYCDF
jgi:hypothetical protein